MKNLLLNSLLLLGLCCARPVAAQVLTFEQLIYLNSQEQMDVDAYLNHRGWVFGSSNKQDSTITSFWYFRMGNKRVSELAVIATIGTRRRIAYTCSARPPFDAIRSKVTAYHMESLGVYNDNTAIRSFFRGHTYELRLEITPGNTLNYHAVVYAHGLTRAYMADGTPTWIDLSRIAPPSEEQKRQWQATADSVETVNQRNHRQ
ncbi:MAG: hypothetical protein ACRYFX_13110 [Janthinobacterium lividum]